MKTAEKPYRYLVLNYDVCKHCCTTWEDQRFGHKNRIDGVMMLVLRDEVTAWQGDSMWQCPHIGTIPVVRPLVFRHVCAQPAMFAVDPGNEIPQQCVCYLEQLLLSKRYRTKAEVRKAWKKRVSERHRQADEERRQLRNNPCAGSA